MERMFEQAAHALEDPSSHAAAARYLEDLRTGSPTQSTQLARAVLSTSASPLAQFQAIVLLRVCLLAAWPHYGPTGEGAQIRDWLLTLAMQRCSEGGGGEGGVGSSSSSSFSPQVLSQVLVTVAVLYKRGWLEDSLASRAALFERLNALCASSPTGAAVGVRLACALAEEFGGGAGGGGGKATALGLPAEWHGACAASFQDTGALRSTFLLALRPVLDIAAGRASTTTTTTTSGGAAPAATPQHQQLSPLEITTLTSALEALACVTGWDFQSKCGVRRDGRLCPDASWGDLFGDPGATVFKGVLGVYTLCRGRPGLSSPLTTARTIISDLCSLEGPVLQQQQQGGGGGGGGITFGLQVLAGISPMLTEGGSWVDGVLRGVGGGASTSSPSSPSSSSGGGGLCSAPMDALETGLSEGSDLHAGLAALLRVHKLRGLGGGGGGGLEVVIGSLRCSAEWIGRLLQSLTAAASTLLRVSRGGGGGWEGALDVMGEALRERSECIWSTVDSALEVWVEIGGELEEESWRGSMPAGIGGPGIPPALTQFLMEGGGALYNALVTARLTTATALIHAGVDDDDNPYEDPSVLEAHLVTVACLGRVSPTLPMFTLAGALKGVAAKFAAAAAAGGGGGSHHQHHHASIAPLCEEVFWLTQYSISLLTDAGTGEVPCIPTSVNAASSNSSSSGGGGGGGDPVVALSTALIETLGGEVWALQASGAQATPRSPLCLATLLTACERWARTYLMPTTTSGNDSASISLNLTRAYGAALFSASTTTSASPSSLAEDVNGGGGLLSPTLSTGPAILEFLLQAASTTVAALGGSGEKLPTTAALALIHRLLSTPATATFAAEHSAILRTLQPHILGMVSGGGIGVSSSTSSSTPSSSPGTGTGTIASTSPFSRLEHTLSPEDAATLLNAFLGLTRYTGSTLPGWESARQASLNDLDSLGPSAAGVGGGGGGGVAIVQALTSQPPPTLHPDTILVLQRWATYSHPFLAALGARTANLHAALNSLLQSQQQQQQQQQQQASPSPHSSLSNPLISSQCTAILSLGSGVLKADNPGIPSAWILPVVVPILECVESIIRVHGGRGPCVTAALSYASDLLAADIEYPGTGELCNRVYAAIAAIFRAFAGAAGRWAAAAASALNTPPTTTPTSPGAAAPAPSAPKRKTGTGGGGRGDDGEELWEDLVLLLSLLQRLCDTECVNFGGGTPASDTLLSGLSLLIPLLSPPILALPKLSSAYMAVTQHILSTHPSQVARLDPPLFAALMETVLSGLRHYDVEVAGGALCAIRDMALFHTAARSKGGQYGALDLSTQLASAPQLFHTLVRAVLSLALAVPAGGVGKGGGSTGTGGSGGSGGGGGGSGNTTSGGGLAQTLLVPAGEAVLGCIRAEPGAFQGAAEALLGGFAASHGGGVASRLASELNELMQVWVSKGSMASPPAAATAALGGGGGDMIQVNLTQTFPSDRNMDRKVKFAFTQKFQDFVTRLRAVLTVL